MPSADRILSAVERSRSTIEPVTFKEVADLTNLSPITRIDVDAPLRVEAQWAVYPARHTIQRQKYEYRVLYLKADATGEDLRAAHRAVGSRLGETDIVYAPSLAAKDRLKHEFAKARSVNDIPGYFKLFLEDDLQKYATNLERTYPPPPYYVPPVIQPPAGVKLRWDSVLDFLRSDPGVGEHDGQRLGVVLAEAGQGKTYHAQYLASQLTKSWRTSGKGLPIYIDSKQWSQLPSDDLASISKTIFHSFRYFSSPLAWVEGHEDRFLRTTLRLGLFTLIFDGLDEYVLWNGRMSAVEPLESLVSMASSTTARLVVTSRSSFWRSEILPLKTDNDDGSVFAYTLLPFDPNHARDYFNKRLDKAKTQADRALGVFRELHTKDPAMAGRGFVLHLVADLFDKTNAPDSLLTNRDEQSVVEWLMTALCERERTRQSLPVSAKEQLLTLSEIAAEVARGAVVDDDLVSLALLSASPAVDVQSVGSALGKIRSHPLIERDGETRRWRFTQEYIRNVLLARYIDGILDASGAETVEALLAEIDTSKGLSAVDLVDLAGVFVTISLARDKQTADRIRLVINACTTKSRGTPVRGPTHARFVSALALGTVEEMLAHGTHNERTQRLTSLFHGTGVPTNCVPRLALSGTVASFDFRGVLFDGCIFEDVTFAKCEFDAKTTFRDCRFTGGRDVASHGFGQAQFLPRATGDPEALRWIKNRQVAESRRKYVAEDLAEDIAAVLRKFMGRGGVGLKTLEEGSLRTGSIHHSPHASEILDALRRHVLEEHPISGGSKGLHVRTEAEEAMRFFGTNNNFTGVVLEAFRELQRKLKLTD